MIPALRPFFLLALILTGCASATVEVAVDIYSKDVLTVRRLGIADAQVLLEGIDNAVSAGREIAAARLQLAENLVAAYDAQKKVFSEMRGLRYQPGSDIIDLQNKLLPAYRQVLQTKQSEINVLATKARERLANYLERAYVGVAKTPQLSLDLIAAQEQAVLALNNLRSQLQTMGGDFGTAFENVYSTLIREAPSELVTLAKVDDKKLSKEAVVAVEELAARFREIARTMTNLDRRGVRLAKELGNGINAAAAKLDPGKPGAVLETVVRTLSSISTSTGLDERGELALGQLGSSLDLYVSQIDRLQDPADPAWRELLRLENETNWAPFFTRTSYRAEGDTGVVIARDRLGHFRVQRAKNNPAALIQGQLRISRAIASSLADALAAATGVPGAGALAGAVKAGVPKPDPTKPDGIKLDGQGEQDPATHAAKLEAQARLRHSARTNLINNLEILNRSLQALKEDKTPVPGDLLTRARAVLEGSKPVFGAKKE
jgi:hypothetical protein